MRELVAWIGLGQCGGNIAKLFEEKGYNCLYINTSQEDLATLDDVKFLYHIPKGEGCNKSRRKAKKLVAEDYSEVLNQIKEKLSEEYVGVVFSTGGGTGSGIAPLLIDLLTQQTSKKVFAVAVMPSKKESYVTNSNTYECFKELEALQKLGATFVLDNNKDDKLKVNKRFVRAFEKFVEIPKHHSVRGNIDVSELKEFLTARGAAIIGVAEKDNKEKVSSARVIESLSNNIFAPIETDRVVKYVALSALNPIDDNELKKFLGEWLDIYKGKNPMLTVAAVSGLTLPYSLIDEIVERLDNERESVIKSHKATSLQRLSKEADIFEELAKYDSPEDSFETTAETIFSKYIN